MPACDGGGERARPQSIRNTCMPLTAFAATAALEEAQECVAEARRQLHAGGLPAALAWLEQTPAVSSGATRTSVLQAIILALGEERHWKCLYAANETVGLPRETVLAYHRGLRRLQAAVNSVTPADLPGFKAFNRQCDAALTRWPLCTVGDTPLALEVARCMHWQAPAFHQIADALKADDTPSVKALWHDYALDAEHAIARGQALRMWKLLIIGNPVLNPRHDRYVDASADQYAGVVIRHLRNGMPVETVVARYPLDTPVLQHWMQENATSLRMGLPLTPSDSINWSTVIPHPDPAHPSHPPR